MVKKGRKCWVIQHKKTKKYKQFVGSGIANYRTKKDAEWDLKSYFPGTMDEYRVVKRVCRLK